MEFILNKECIHISVCGWVLTDFERIRVWIIGRAKVDVARDLKYIAECPLGQQIIIHLGRLLCRRTIIDQPSSLRLYGAPTVCCQCSK